MDTLTEERVEVLTGEELSRQQEMDRWLEVFSIFIHDLESPLASVKYLLKRLANGKLDPTNEQHQRLIHSSDIAVRRAESILYDVMAVARAGKAGIPIQLDSIRLKDLVNEAVALAGGTAADQDITLQVASDISDTPVQADPRLLTRVIDNLVYNAIRHTPAGGTVLVSTEPGTRCVFLHVKDDGPGLGDIDPSVLFEKYGQLQLRAKGLHRGVGLGLYFCKLAATGMGGTVMADDHADGGAVFSIKLNISEG